jgi:hypothetical protein
LAKPHGRRAFYPVRSIFRGGSKDVLEPDRRGRRREEPWSTAALASGTA